MSEFLKGNYKLKEPLSPATPPASSSGSAEQQFEAEALQKLGGSIAFIKKSSSFVWNGGKKDEPRPPTG